MSILDRVRNITTPSTPPPTDPQLGVPLDTALNLLANERRRITIGELRNQQEITIDELARRLAAIENCKPPGAITGPERKRVWVSLYQTHLDQLNTNAVVDWDPEHGDIIRRGDNWAAFSHVLDVLNEYDGTGRQL